MLTSLADYPRLTGRCRSRRDAAGVAHGAMPTVAALPLHLRFLRWVALLRLAAAQDPTCPCLGAFGPVPPSGCTEVRLAVEMDNPLYATESFVNLPGICYPNSYGSTCSAWDAGLLPYCAGSRNASACARQWCYVDYSTCRLSQIATDRSRLFQSSGSGLFYSYETCDSQASQPISELASRAHTVASTMTLTIAVAANDPPVIFKRDPSTGEPEPAGLSASYFNDSVPWEGALVNFYAEISQRYGANFRFATVSGASALAYADRWTAAGYEATRGIVDLSVPTWHTSDRSEMSAFAAPLYNDYYYLYVPVSRAYVSMLERASYAFLPFSIPLWLVCGLITIIMGAVVSALEATEINTNPRALIRGLGRGTYYSLVQLLTGFEAKEAASVPLRILYVGWAFFVCLVLAAYTANFAAFLVKNPMTKSFETLEAAIEQDPNVRICHPAAITSAIITDHPGVVDNLVVVPWVVDIGPEYDAAECNALIWSEQLLQVVPETMQYFCEEGMTKQDFVTSVSIAEPVHDPDVGAVISYWHNRLYQEFGVTYLSYEASYYDRPEGCEDWHSLENSASAIFAQRQDNENQVGRRLHDRRAKHKTGFGTGRRLRAGASRGGSVGGANVANGDNSEEHSLTIAHFFGPILMWIISVLAAIAVRIIVGLPATLEEQLEATSAPGLKNNSYLKHSISMMKLGTDMINGDEEEGGDTELKATGKPDSGAMTRHDELESSSGRLQMARPSLSATMTAESSSVMLNDEDSLNDEQDQILAAQRASAISPLTMYRSSERPATPSAVVNDPTSASRVATRPGTPNMATASSAKPTPPHPSTQAGELTLPRSLVRNKSFLRDRSKDAQPTISAGSIIIEPHAKVSELVYLPEDERWRTSPTASATSRGSSVTPTRSFLCDFSQDAPSAMSAGSIIIEPRPRTLNQADLPEAKPWRASPTASGTSRSSSSMCSPVGCNSDDLQLEEPSERVRRFTALMSARQVAQRAASFDISAHQRK